MEVVDKQDRNILGEGRNRGVGFAFCKLKDDVFTTVMPISPCKDYLNDLIFVENTKLEIGTVHGFNYKVTKCLNEDSYSYMIAKVCPIHSCGNHSTFDEEEKALISNYKGVQTILNYFEDKLELKDKTITDLIDNNLIFHVPDWWCKEGWRISFYTLIIRIAIFYDSKITIEDFFKTYKDVRKDSDSFILSGVLDKFYKIIELKKTNKLDKIDCPTYKKEVKENPVKYGSTIHNAGICSVKIKE